MKFLVVVLSKFYWLAVASIPLLFWYLFGTFRAPRECVESSTCIQFYSPLDAVSVAVVLLASVLLWPMCALKILRRKL